MDMISITIFLGPSTLTRLNIKLVHVQFDLFIVMN